MNKIYSNQMSIASALAQGIRENEALLQQQGIHIDTQKLDELNRELEQMAIRQEEAEIALREVREKAHELLSELKDLCNESKSPIKLAFPPEQWAKFGLADKR